MVDPTDMTEGAIAEMKLLGVLDGRGVPCPPSMMDKLVDPDRHPIPRKAVSAMTLNEAPAYRSCFSRATAFDVGPVEVLLVSGTASIDEHGQTAHPGDFAAQMWRTLRNITELLRANGMTWHHVMHTRCYLRDMARDYALFNEIRCQYYTYVGLNPYPASVAVEAGLCRSDLLVEIEAVALART